MAKPVWVTPAGSLGTLPEGVFYQQAMLADVDPLPLSVVCTATTSGTNRITCNSTEGLWPGLNVIFTGDQFGTFGGISPLIRYFVLEVVNSTQFTITATEFTTQPVVLTTATGSMTAEFKQHISFLLQAGVLPDGIAISDNGLIVGVPKAVASIQGVPNEVARDITSKFTVRAYTQKLIGSVLVLDRIADRTFSITVTGQDAPAFVTPAGNIGTFFDGSPIAPIQIEISNTDPSETTVITVAVGSLPPGLTISTSGLISGYIIPLSPVDATAGFSRDGQGFEEYPFDFSTRSASTNYQFTLEVTDGVSSDLRTYEIYVYSRDSMTADTTDFTADNTFLTADLSPIRVPFLVNSSPSNLGTVRGDNFWAYQFVGLDLDGDPIEYVVLDDSASALPPGLTLDTFTGWLYGYLPDLGATENFYSFSIFVRKSNNEAIFSDPYPFTMTVVGQIDTDVTWLTDADLGTINNGETSTLAVKAVNLGNRALQYQLKSGSYPIPDTGVYNKLPQGLQLLSDGSIAGRVSFNTFALDGGTTVFDSTRGTQLTAIDETTFDSKFVFTVNAYSADGLVSVFKTFNVTVIRTYNEPYENLYIKAMPPEQDRALINQLIQNTDIIPPSVVYRSTDPNFGIAKSVIYNHAFGLTSATYAEYVSSLNINHYWKNLTLGQIETAQALDSAGNILYEVVYSKIIDDLVNNDDESVNKEVLLPYPVNEADSTEIDNVYPNSLINMRDQVIDVVGKVSEVLPRWMISKQKNGRVLGFVPAWVICYTTPNNSGRVAYNIQQQFGDQLNKIDFEVDRYELDKLLSIHWDPIADSTGGSWVPTPAETTFDLVNHYEVTVINGGADYNIGDQILILGSQLGGQDSLNNVIITVQDVDANGTITILNLSGNAPLFSTGDAYSGISGTNISGSGAGATFNFVVGSGQGTTFDATSLRFEAPVDNYTSTDAFDKYLVFPRRNILV